MGNNIKRYIKNMEIVSLPKPTSPGNTYDDKDKDIRKQEVGDFAKR